MVLRHCRHPASIGTGWKNRSHRRGPSFDHPPWRQLPRAWGPIGGPLSKYGVQCGTHGTSGALSLSGRGYLSTFGIMIGI